MRTIPQRRRSVRAKSASGVAMLGRLEGEDRLYRGMKDRFAYAIPERGSCEYLYRGRTYQQRPGLVVLKQPGEMYREIRRNEPATFDLVFMDVDVVHEARDAVAPGRDVVFDDPELAADDPRARALLTLHAVLRRGDDPLADDSAVAEAALALARIGTATDRSIRHERPAVRRARAYLLERLAEQVRLDDLADHVGLDKYHLIRAFRADVGAPPYEFLTHARIHRARELLRRGVPAAEVAAAVGYYDQSQLHRHFVRLVGITPGRYARSR